MADHSLYKIRPMHASDKERVRVWRNSDHVRAYMYNDELISEKAHSSWFDFTLSDQASNYQIYEYDHKPIGLASATMIDRKNQRCFWAFYLGETDTPKGAGAMLEYLMLEHVFTNLGIRKLCCEVFAFNDKVIKLHHKFGFKQEALYKAHTLKNGEFQDVHGLALFKEEWESVKPKMGKILFR
jgi:UDP-4-amino-4,6-dideoxy-N-acetyl-beta-L-altrosamine N-acetyltransferase